MNPARLEKIRALANDARGDPATRAVAQSILKRYARDEPKPKFRDVPHVDPRVHGLRRDPLYEHYLYTDLSQWDKTKAGNPTYQLFHRGIVYRIVLFKHRRTDTYGWMRIDTDHDETEFSGRFNTMAEAQADGWVQLMMK